VIHGPVTRPDGVNFVAVDQGRIAGFVGTATYGSNAGHGESGCIRALYVAPALQRRGIGTALYDAALGHLRSSGLHHIQLGGGLVRFWPGIPHNLPAALAFFRAMGWDDGFTAYDLLQDLSAYVSPPEIAERMAEMPFRLSTAREEDVPALLEFEDREFPGWSDAFRDAVHLGDHDDALIARDADGNVVGALIMVTPRSHPNRTDAPWTALLGSQLGGMGSVGVAASHRGHGIGLALVARASKILRERGARYGHIGWTGLVDFYGRLGYIVWREFQVSRREIR
jgi:ribosomal protein S18 acetylase RimI-like enzyme